MIEGAEPAASLAFEVIDRSVKTQEEIISRLIDSRGGAGPASAAGAGVVGAVREGAASAPSRDGDAVVIPLAASRKLKTRSTAGAVARQADRIDLRGVRVLVVDDESDIREFVARALRSFGAEVALASSAREAVEALDRFRPQVLVSDIAMPGEDGCSLIRRIRKRPAEDGGQLPAMALTAFGREEDRARALAAGYQIYAVKPLAPETLADLVADLAGRIPGSSPMSLGCLPAEACIA